MRRWTDFIILIAVLAAMVALFGSLRDSFLSAATLGSVTNRVPALALVATGMTLVMVTGGIDLSVGSVLGLCGATVGVMMEDWHWRLMLALLGSILVGGVIGSTTGAVSVKLRLPSFIVSLGMLEIARGLAFLTTNSQTKYIGAGIESLGAPFAGLVISPAFVISVLFVIAGQVLLSHTAFGRHLIAIGANREAALISGVPVDRPRILAHAALGALTGLAAVSAAGGLRSIEPTVADLQQRLAGDVDTPADSTPRTRSDRVFRRDGAVWHVAFNDRAATVPHARGMNDLRALLARPHEPVSVMELAVDGGIPHQARGPGAFDERARREIRARLRELESAIAEAEDAGNTERAALIREQRRELAEMVARDLGLGGRSRRIDDPIERARKTVSTRIRRTTRR